VRVCYAMPSQALADERGSLEATRLELEVASGAVAASKRREAELGNRMARLQDELAHADAR
jgi:hypothetical protein